VSVGEFGIEIFLESNVVAGDGGSQPTLRTEKPHWRIHAQIGGLGRAFHAHPLVAIYEDGIYHALGATECRIVTSLIEHKVAVMRILLCNCRRSHNYNCN